MVLSNLSDSNSGSNKPYVRLGAVTHLTPTAKGSTWWGYCLQNLARTWQLGRTLKLSGALTESLNSGNRKLHPGP